MEIRVHPAKIGLLDSHFIATIRQPNRTGVFELHILNVEREAREIRFHGQCFGPRSKARYVKTAIYQAESRHPRKMQRRDEERVEINSLRGDLGIHRIVATKAEFQFSRKATGGHRGIYGGGQVS